MMIDRNKFKSDIGRKCYDLILTFNPPNEDFVYLMLCLAKGDERRKVLINFLEHKCKNVKDLCNFVIENWG